MKQTIIKSCLVAVVGTVCTLSTAFANVLAPGQTVAPDVFAPNGSGVTMLATTGQLTIDPVPGSSFNVTYVENVYSDTNNVFCAGCLDFVIFASNSGPGTYERISTADFTSFLTDVGYVSGTSGATPNSVNRNDLGSVIAFNFLGSSVSAGQATAPLVIETNARSYTTGTVSVQDGYAGFNAGFAPTNTPEPASLVMFGTGIALIGFSKKLIRNRKKA